jgi:Domain of unknown function (DUF4262)
LRTRCFLPAFFFHPTGQNGLRDRAAVVYNQSFMQQTPNIANIEKIEKIRKLVESSGLQVVGVENPFPVTYTIGLLELFDQSEIVITGMPIQISYQLLNFLRDEMQHGRRFEPGTVYTDITDEGYRFVFREVHGSHLSGDVFETGLDYYTIFPTGKNFSVWQLFWCGEDKKFHWEEYASMTDSQQPRLDLPAATSRGC